jgi:hypothetical protein
MSPIEYVAKSNWLRNQTVVTQEVRNVRSQLRATTREVEFELGLTIEQWVKQAAPEGGRGFPTHRGFVAFFHDRPGQPLGAGKNTRIHADRDCFAIAQIPDEDIREASENEVTYLLPCGHCH